MIKVEPGTPIARLDCRVCSEPVQAGERVLVSYSGRQPSVIHAGACKPARARERASAD